MSGPSSAIVIVPCFNEASRLDPAEFLRLAESAEVWMVDDGSGDSTGTELAAIAARSNGRVKGLANPANLGKAETVRRHLVDACAAGATFVGFLDADLATPVDEWLAMLQLLASRDIEAVTGARVALSGREIHRSAARHYAGRIFSTVASLAIGAPWYDTQCGAKVFRCGPPLLEALSEPFLSRWAFDVELIGRLLAGGPRSVPVPARRLVEFPLQRWEDVAGSKLTAADAWKSAAELLLIWRDLAKRRRASIS
jgi:dolichyl-phosphate beta-glucosyltransferase